MSGNGDDSGLIDFEESDAPGDRWEEVDVSETEADRVAKKRDRKFLTFQKRIKDADQLKVEGAVFDEATLAAIYTLVQHGHIDAFGGPISTGKEANVFLADGPDGEVAVKIYRINASDFKHMREYLEGDPRFEGIASNKKAVVLAWTKKELANLQRAKRAGVHVPEPIAAERNVLVMDFLGTDGERAKRLGEVHLENPRTAFEVVREYARRLYRVGLIHGDLSEYNVVVHDSAIYVIDLGQAVTIHHPNSREFLERDCRNVAKFFARQGLDIDATGEALLEYVIESEPESESA